MSSKLGWPTWIGVVADDLQGQVAFSRDVLGFRLVDIGADWAEFDVDGNELEIIARSALPQYESRRTQVGFEVDDIATARADLEAAGVEAISEIDGDEGVGGRWAYFRDPEGNVFEIKERRRG